MSKEIVTRIAPPVALSAPEFTFEQLQRMAATFAKSNLFGIKDPDQALALMLVAHAEGKHPALVAKDYNVIQNRPAKTAEAMLRDFQSTGGRVEWIELSDTRAAAKFSHPLAPTPVLIDWDMERATRAGLAKKDGGMYQKYARAMLRSRCVSEGVRSTAPQATSGFYTPEEIRAIAEEEEAVTTPVQTLEVAVAQAAEQTKNALSQEEIDRIVQTLDVKTIPELTTAFAAAWKAGKGDDKARKIFKSWYDDMRAAIEASSMQGTDDTTIEGNRT